MSGAFPHSERNADGSHYFSHPGLTKRELIAAMAMQGIVGSIDSEENYDRLRQHARRDGLKVSEWIARDSVKQADALLAELAKGGEK